MKDLPSRNLIEISDDSDFEVHCKVEKLHDTDSDSSFELPPVVPPRICQLLQMNIFQSIVLTLRTSSSSSSAYSVSAITHIPNAYSQVHSTRSPVRSTTRSSFTRSFYYCSFYYSFTCSFYYLFTRSFYYSFTCLFYYLFTCSFYYSFTHSFYYSFTSSFYYLFTCSFYQVRSQMLTGRTRANHARNAPADRVSYADHVRNKTAD